MSPARISLPKHNQGSVGKEIGRMVVGGTLNSVCILVKAKLKMFFYHKPLRAFNVLMNTESPREEYYSIVIISQAYLTMKTFFGRTFITIFWNSIIPQSVVSEMLI